MATPPRPLACPRCSGETKSHCPPELSHTCDLIACLGACGYGTHDGRHWYETKAA